MAALPPGLRESSDSSDHPDESAAEDIDWKEFAFQLDVPNHDIWIFQDEELIENGSTGKFDVADFGDRSPDRDGPDLDVWPLDYWDPGEADTADELTRITNSYPVPHVAWVTDEYLQRRCGYTPTAVELQGNDVAPYLRPAGVGSMDTFTATPSVPPMKLSEDRRTALNRVARLWNGDVVRGQHLLLDKLPSYEDILGDLDGEELRRLHNPPVNRDLLEAFGHCAWFQLDYSLFLTDSTVLRKTCYYSPTQAMRTLVREDDRFPALRGDAFESLRHRVGVALVVVRHKPRFDVIKTYADVGRYSVDFYGGRGMDPLVVEVVTGHNNWQYHRKTYRKLADLSTDMDIHVLFDDRETACSVINHWLRQGLAELPNGTFDSEPALDWMSEKIQEAAEDPTVDWVIDDVSTITSLWSDTLGSDSPPSADYVLSLDW